MMANCTIPSDSQERLGWVLYQLKARRSSFATIARKLGNDRSTVRRAMFQPSYPQEKAIADELGITVRQLFPERYDAEGNRRHWTRECEDSSKVTPDNVKGGRAA